MEWRSTGILILTTITPTLTLLFIPSDSAEPFGPESFDPELMTEGLTTEGLVADSLGKEGFYCGIGQGVEDPRSF